jgi:hypothetical protein
MSNNDVIARSRPKNNYRRSGWAGPLALGLLLAVVLPATVVQASDVVVAVDLPPTEPASGKLVVRIGISTVEGIDAVQFDLRYDPDLLQVFDVTPGDIGGAPMPTAAWGLLPAGQPGVVRVIGNVPGAPGLSGSGYLADVHFRVIGSGCTTSAILLYNGLLGNKDGRKIPADWLGRSLLVCDGQQVEADHRTGSPTAHSADVAASTPRRAQATTQPAGPASTAEAPTPDGSPTSEPTASVPPSLPQMPPGHARQNAPADVPVQPAAVAREAQGEAAGVEREPAAMGMVTATVPARLASAATGTDHDALGWAGGDCLAPGAAAAPPLPESGESHLSWAQVGTSLGALAAIVAGGAVLRRAVR